MDFSVNTKDKLSALYLIDEKLSAFFSAKYNVVENMYEGYSDKVIEEMRYIALLTKGGHSLTRVKNRMKMLAYYVNDVSNTQIPFGIDEID